MEKQLPTVLIEIEGGIAEISHDIPFNVVLIDYDIIEKEEGDTYVARAVATEIKEWMANATAPEYVDYNDLRSPNWAGISALASQLREDVENWLIDSIPHGEGIAVDAANRNNNGESIKKIQRGGGHWLIISNQDGFHIPTRLVDTDVLWDIAAQVEKAIAGGNAQ